MKKTIFKGLSLERKTIMKIRFRFNDSPDAFDEEKAKSDEMFDTLKTGKSPTSSSV
ncbi:MAG: hypothetical protein ACI4CS_04600 [Candidatus Weimeria sp.]